MMVTERNKSEKRGEIIELDVCQACNIIKIIMKNCEVHAIYTFTPSDEDTFNAILN